MEYKFKTDPYEHQLSALNSCKFKTNWALFMDMGTGKTKTTIDNLGILYSHKYIDSALIIAPKSVYTIWDKEIETHLSDEIKRNIVVWNVSKKENFDDNKLNFFLINVEALSTKKGFEKAHKFLLGRKAAIVLDEATTIKNMKAKRTKNILKLGPLAVVRRILTGSPVTKSPLDLFTQCKFLSPKLLGYDSFYAFRARYAEMHTIFTGVNTQVSIPKYYKNLDELEYKLKEFSTRVKKEDCLDIPPKTYEQRYVQLSGKQGIVYKRLRDNAIAIVNDNTISFQNKLTELIKLHEVTNGFVKSNDGKIEELDNPKLDEMMAILEEINGKAIIWANYIKNIDQICQKLGEKYGPNSFVKMYGATSVDGRKKACHEFQNNPAVKFFVSNPTTGGYGLTLHAASYVIYFSNNYNLEVRLQSEDRAHRIGQKKNVTYIDLIVKNTVDEKIVGALDKKLNLAAETLGEKIKSWIV
tara:strand:+ start:18408 stop:19814 length:1407 start_codon:yes stop_codon:yes gene_type:complete